MIENVVPPLLSIAIPTFNRAALLQLCLAQLLPQLAAVGKLVEVTVYDNASPDHTQEVVQSFVARGYKLTYCRNSENVGSDRNIAQCFNLAKGRYVLILGDDDVVLGGALKKMVTLLSSKNFGAVFVNAYGFDVDFLKEQPIQVMAGEKFFSDANEFINKCFVRATFISSLLINKSSCRDLDANKFVGTSLVQTYLFYEAILRQPLSVYVNEYWLAARRTEHKDYDVVGIFCGQYNRVLEAFMGRGLLPATVDAINRKMLWHFLPFHLALLRGADMPKSRAAEVYSELHQRYHKEPLFWLCCMPILRLPARLGRLWGYGLVVLGRLVNGEFGRLWVGVRERFRRKGVV